MGNNRCPGQDRRYWKPEDIFEVRCPQCGSTVELWKDEGVSRCSNCGTPVVNQRVAQGCAQWCRFAEECLGFRAGENGGAFSIEQKLTGLIKSFFGEDARSFKHSLSVLGWAERIMEKEGGKPPVVKASAILHELAGEVNSSGPDKNFSVPEKHALLDMMMNSAGITETLKKEVKNVISRFFYGNGQESTEYFIFSDAHALSELQEDLASCGCIHLSEFYTRSGKKLAEKLVSQRT